MEKYPESPTLPFLNILFAREVKNPEKSFVMIRQAVDHILKTYSDNKEGILPSLRSAEKARLNYLAAKAAFEANNQGMAEQYIEQAQKYAHASEIPSSEGDLFLIMWNGKLVIHTYRCYAGFDVIKIDIGIIEHLAKSIKSEKTITLPLPDEILDRNHHIFSPFDVDVNKKRVAFIESLTRCFEDGLKLEYDSWKVTTVFRKLYLACETKSEMNDLFRRAEKLTSIGMVLFKNDIHRIGQMKYLTIDIFTALDQHEKVLSFAKENGDLRDKLYAIEKVKGIKAKAEYLEELMLENEGNPRARMDATLRGIDAWFQAGDLEKSKQLIHQLSNEQMTNASNHFKNIETYENLQFSLVYYAARIDWYQGRPYEATEKLREIIDGMNPKYHLRTSLTSGSGILVDQCMELLNTIRLVNNFLPNYDDIVLAIGSLRKSIESNVADNSYKMSRRPLRADLTEIQKELLDCVKKVSHIKLSNSQSYRLIYPRKSVEQFQNKYGVEAVPDIIKSYSWSELISKNLLKKLLRSHHKSLILAEYEKNNRFVGFAFELAPEEASLILGRKLPLIFRETNFNTHGGAYILKYKLKKYYPYIFARIAMNDMNSNSWEKRYIKDLLIESPEYKGVYETAKKLRDSERKSR